VLLSFGSDFGGPYLGCVFFLFLKIERSEGEEKHRSENEKNDGFRKPSEKIENRGEYEVYEEEQDVHPPRS